MAGVTLAKPEKFKHVIFTNPLWQRKIWKTSLYFIVIILIVYIRNNDGKIRNKLLSPRRLHVIILSRYDGQIFIIRLATIIPLRNFALLFQTWSAATNACIYVFYPQSPGCHLSSAWHQRFSPDSAWHQSAEYAPCQAECVQVSVIIRGAATSGRCLSPASAASVFDKFSNAADFTFAIQRFFGLTGVFRVTNIRLPAPGCGPFRWSAQSRQQVAA